jgi:hypothetical protein
VRGVGNDGGKFVGLVVARLQHRKVE